MSRRLLVVSLSDLLGTGTVHPLLLALWWHHLKRVVFAPNPSLRLPLWYTVVAHMGSVFVIMGRHARRHKVQQRSGGALQNQQRGLTASHMCMHCEASSAGSDAVM